VKTVLRVVAILLVAAVILPALAAACPLCKEAASDADKPGATSVWRGMYWSILFMIAAPFAMVGTMIVLVRRARRRLPAPTAAPASPLRPLPESSGEGL
jgi:hypothetical protein